MHVTQSACPPIQPTVCCPVYRLPRPELMPSCPAFISELSSRSMRMASRGLALVAQTIRNLPAMREIQVPSLGGEDPPEKGQATHSSIPAWRTPWTEEPGGQQSTGSQSRTRLGTEQSAPPGIAESAALSLQTEFLPPSHREVLPWGAPGAPAGWVLGRLRLPSRLSLCLPPQALASCWPNWRPRRRRRPAGRHGGAPSCG